MNDALAREATHKLLPSRGRVDASVNNKDAIVLKYYSVFCKERSCNFVN